MPTQTDTGSFFSETSNQNERILFTSESVGEGHPGKTSFAQSQCPRYVNICIPSSSPSNDYDQGHHPHVSATASYLARAQLGLVV